MTGQTVHKMSVVMTTRSEIEEQTSVMTNRRPLSFGWDLLYFGLLAIACVLVGGLMSLWWRGEAGWELWMLVGMVSFAISIPTTFLIHSRMTKDYPAAAPLLATMWRGGAYVVLLFYLDATKWQDDYFAHIALMGCYFPYLVLESSLFIRKVSRT